MFAVSEKTTFIFRYLEIVADSSIFKLLIQKRSQKYLKNNCGHAS